MRYVIRLKWLFQLIKFIYTSKHYSIMWEYGSNGNGPIARIQELNLKISSNFVFAVTARLGNRSELSLIYNFISIYNIEMTVLLTNVNLCSYFQIDKQIYSTNVFLISPIFSKRYNKIEMTTLGRSLHNIQEKKWGELSKDRCKRSIDNSTDQLKASSTIHKMTNAKRKFCARVIYIASLHYLKDVVRFHCSLIPADISYCLTKIDIKGFPFVVSVVALVKYSYTRWWACSLSRMEW